MSKAERARDKIARLAVQGLDVARLWRESADPVADVVPNYMKPCWYTLDPASLLITSHFNEAMAALPPDSLHHEYFVDDVNKLADIARSKEGISTLHDAMDGDPASSPRWQANIQMGGDQEMIAALRTKSGDVWGALGIYREPDTPMFDEDDKAFMLVIAPLLAEGARRALLVGEASDPDTEDSPGLLVLSADCELDSTTPGVERWLEEFPDGDLKSGRLPSAVVSVASRALQSSEVAVARVMSRSGAWVVLHGAVLGSAGERRVAVIVEPAHPARISSLLMSVYGLTEREKDVTRLVLQGNSTTEIADELVVSPHTIQQHLKAIFDKTGVRSRRDLVGKVFFAHYEPRLRDNELRAASGLSVRGQPVSG